MRLQYACSKMHLWIRGGSAELQTGCKNEKYKDLFLFTQHMRGLMGNKGWIGCELEDAGKGK